MIIVPPLKRLNYKIRTLPNRTFTNKLGVNISAKLLYDLLNRPGDKSFVMTRTTGFGNSVNYALNETGSIIHFISFGTQSYNNPIDVNNPFITPYSSITNEQLMIHEIVIGVNEVPGASAVFNFLNNPPTIMTGESFYNNYYTSTNDPFGILGTNIFFATRSLNVSNTNTITLNLYSPIVHNPDAFNVGLIEVGITNSKDNKSTFWSFTFRGGFNPINLINDPLNIPTWGSEIIYLIIKQPPEPYYPDFIPIICRLEINNYGGLV